MISLCVVCTALASCQRGQSPQEPTPAQGNVAYEFTVRAGAVMFDGMLYAGEDTMRVQLRDGSCWADSEPQTSIGSTRFKCQGAMGVHDLRLAFDTRYPQRSSRWSGYALRQVTRRECTAYITNEKGQRVCASMQSTTAEEAVHVSGVILRQRQTPVP